MKKTFHYKNELTDDFGSTVKKTVPLSENYNYKDGNIFFRIISFFLYRFIARPFAWCYMKIKFHHKFANKSVLKSKSLKGGFLIYENHVTHMGDAFISNLLCVRRRNYIITGKDTNSLTSILWLMKAVGNIPLGQKTHQQVAMLRCVRRKVAGGHSVTIFPEAHIWPYYTDIRPFSSHSFKYALLLGVPVVALTTTFQKRKFLKTPRIVTYIDGPFYPDPNKNHSENAEYLRELVYTKMKERAAHHSTYKYHTYINEQEEVEYVNSTDNI